MKTPVLTMTIPVLSTAHMPGPMALENLTGCMTATYDEGGFVLVLGNEDREDWLKPIAEWAARHQYTWVRFDADGDVVDGLDVYDWDAGDGSAMLSNSLLDNKED